MPTKILIFDTTLRDGEQSPGASLTVSEKLLIAKQLAKLGVDVIEAGFPISSEGDFESVKLIAEQVKGPIICALARTLPEDIDRAWEAVKDAEKPRIHTFVATSQIHITQKLRKTKEEVIKLAVDGVARAKSYCKDVEFSPEDAARTDIDYMCEVVRAAIKAGATTINIPDTVGYAEPEEYGGRIKALLEKVPEAKNIVVSVHCHDDLGNAAANSLAGVRNGATQVECTINGIGERAGNASLEEVAMNLKVRKDFFKDFFTEIKTEEIFNTSRMVSELTGLVVQRNKAIVGQNAFAHEAGIHQHGVLSGKQVYEIMDAASVGWRGDNLVLGKHSGKHAVEAVLKEMGYELDKEKVEIVIGKIKALADKKKEVMKEDIVAIAADVVGELKGEEKSVELVEFTISTGNKIKPNAHVTLLINGEKKSGEAKGVGPVDAISNAITSLIEQPIRLKEYGLKAITGGTDALADVSISVEDNSGNVFKANAVNEDIVMASAMALIKGLNRALNFRVKGGKEI
ncbi:2-isopropylmalate synthase [Candidatus Woesearchaeota archaeon]|nr:2-isopropylmalate synthase [Candidatus Woesearchaeota archaeon]